MPKLKIIVNPTAGRGAGGRAIPTIRGALEGFGLPFDLVRTEQPWHAAELARQAVADGSEVVVAAGGDGTANEVLNGLLMAQRAGLGKAAMGILPVGRGNDFCYSMGAPMEVLAGCQALAHNRRRPLDVGWMQGGLYPQGRFFGNGVGIGFDAVVGFQAVKFRPLRGFASYTLGALVTMFLYYRAPLVRVDYDDHSVTQPALMVSIMNGRRLGGGFMMAPKGSAEDGVFDVTIADQVPRVEMLKLIVRFMQGSQAGHPAIHLLQARKVKVTALNGALPAHADGETLCVDGTEISLELLPGALELVY